MSKILFGPSYNNTQCRDEWIIRKLLQFLKDKLLDAGASERLYKNCSHLYYILQNFCLYDGIGDETGTQMNRWDVDSIKFHWPFVPE